VVHRDLKPDNVLIVGAPGEDLVKILDFGVAKLIEGDGGPSELSVVAGSLLGTAQYMSPEQVRCEIVDARADLYAVGILLYEMLTGRRPFDGERDLAVLHKQLEQVPVPPRQLTPAISPALDAAILRALEKDKDRRWRTAEDFSRALAKTPEGKAAPPVAGVQRRATTALPIEAVKPRRRRQPARTGLWVLLFVLALAVAAGGVVLAAQRGLIDLPLPAWLQQPAG
jgi:serine/threonine protein kinase